MATPKALSEQLRQYVRQVESSQRQLAFRAGIDPAVLSKFLNGQGGLSIEAIDELGKLLGLKLTTDRTVKATALRRRGK